ncbi:MAG TPA: ATP-binding protein [Candidatus Binatia bacterium]|jgi:signal transduction histidine kinase|nr:ATP-binding protein [Candidatus Binatia bacterium]
MAGDAEDKVTQHFSIQQGPVEADSAVGGFRRVPHADGISEGESDVAWRVWFAPATDPSKQFGLEINGEVILGRRVGMQDSDDIVDLNALGAGKLGVSRRHLMLRPTATNLFIVDLGSTNGTYRNGRSIGSHTPYSLVDGDMITLAKLPLLVKIVERPSLPANLAIEKLDVTEAMAQIAKAITSQLDLDDVLNQVAETARALTAAGETGIWLVDEGSGELLLEAQRGIVDERVRRTRLPSGKDTLAGEALRTNKTVRASRQPGQDDIKLKTGYFVSAIVYVPITLGGVTFGVLSAAHREPGMQFSAKDERLLEAIGDFAAIAIQNARQYQRTDAALERRVKEVSALNQLTFTLSSSLDLDKVYKVLVEQVNRHWPVEAVELYLIDEENEKLLRHGHGHDGRSGPYYETKESRANSLVGEVLRSGRLTFTNDLQNAPSFMPAIDAPGIDVPRSIVCAPLRVKDRTVGVLTLINKIDGSFTEDDASRLRAFASPVATAVENARLFAESERRRRAIEATAHTLPEPLLILDERGRLLVANDAADRLLKLNMSDLFEAISSGVGRTTEVVVGDETFLSTAQHVDDVGTIVVMQDITYVKKLEEDRSDFMHALSHDMRNPLTSIIGYTEVMERTSELDDRFGTFLGRIRTAADRMLEMVTQLLRTVDAEIYEQLEWEPCALPSIMDKVVHDVEGMALSKSIQVRLELDGDPYEIMADANRLYHAVLNLVENAVKYSPPETKVTVAAKFAEQGAVIDITDEGPGIPEDDLPRIFEKYYRGEAVSDMQGNGLGLAVVRTIVEAHGGSVKARNRPRGGAQFTITLPLERPSAGRLSAVVA